MEKASLEEANEPLLGGSELSFERKSRIGGTKSRLPRLLLAIGVLLGLIALSFSQHIIWGTALDSNPLSVSHRRIKKPAGLKVVGLVFYGRPRYVSLVDCYLRRNLISHGGWLDEVVFYENTDDQNALQWLNQTVESEPLYRIARRPEWARSGYSTAWLVSVTEPDTIYVKVDDDMAFIADDAIALMVEALLSDKENYIVLANLINAAALNWFHWHNGVYHPFLPEMDDPPPHDPTAWRPSQLPQWQPNFSTPEWANMSAFDWTQTPSPEVHEWAGPPARNHRWLPVPINKTMEHTMLRTPVSQLDLSPWGVGLSWWTIATQKHFSFFKNLEDGRLDRYVFAPGPAYTWNTYGQMRANLNVVAIRGRDVIDNPPRDDDEGTMTQDIPARLERPVLIHAQALANHYAFHFAVDSVDTTDVLSRYRALAFDFGICHGDLGRDPTLS